MQSYSRHRQSEEELAGAQSLPSCYAAPSSIDAWRHDRMLLSILPLLETCPQSSWLTVGDGRFGSEAYFLGKHGVKATATSISDATLIIARERAYIGSFSEQNAESFTFEDDSFDWVLCKESFHHLPRPAIGFYEMLRVAKQGVVLIEPLEEGRSVVTRLKIGIKRLLRREHPYDQFEPAGNFVYRINVRETAKMLTALGHTHIAWKGFNNFWYAPFDQFRAHRASTAWLITRLAIAVQNLLCSVRLLEPGLAAVVCFKTEPGQDTLRSLKRASFEVLTLPKNPY